MVAHIHTYIGQVREQGTSIRSGLSSSSSPSAYPTDDIHLDTKETNFHLQLERVTSLNTIENVS